MKLKILIFILFFASSGCDDLHLDLKPVGESNQTSEEAEVHQTKTYLIQSGHHYSTKTSFQKAELKNLNFRFMFDSTAIYKTKDPANQGDINKLYGLSDCGDFHHQNSARFGWRWYNNALEIWAYAYHDGKRKYQFLQTIAIKKFYDGRISFENGKYIFQLDDTQCNLTRSCDSLAYGYKLYPYFGGDETAPNDIRIYIEDIVL